MKKGRICALLLMLGILCTGCSEETPPETTAAPAVETVAVTFQPNNGEGNIVLDVEKGTLIQDPPVPVKRACEFAGWYFGETLWDPATNIVDKPIQLTAKWTLAADAFQADPNVAVRAEGTDIRVCSFNILSPDRGAKHPLADRPNGVASMALRYQPDVIGIQEYDSPWHPALLEAFKDTGYQLVSGDSYKIDGVSSSRQLLYRTDKLTLIEFGLEDCVVGSDYNGRFIWALFETKDEAKQRFVAVSVHWYWNSEDIRAEEANIFCEWLQETKAKYGVPIVSMGDYNAKESELSYFRLMKKGQMKDAKYEALTRGLVASTYHSQPSADSYPEEKVNTVLSIDHIVYTDDMQALYYDTIIDEETLKSSDHNPIYADLKFKSAS